MSHSTDQTATAEQLALLPEDGKRYELWDGVLHVMSPSGARHGEVAARLLFRIMEHAVRYQLGKTYAAETGFLLRREPDTVLAPDVAFISFDRLGELAHHAGYLPLAPELVAEVVSPTDRASEIDAKAHAWLAAGVHVVLVVDPSTSTVRAYRSQGPVQALASGCVDLHDVLPGLQLAVSDLFS